MKYARLACLLIPQGTTSVGRMAYTPLPQKIPSEISILRDHRPYS
jgi:hypothetical protein